MIRSRAFQYSLGGWYACNFRVGSYPFPENRPYVGFFPIGWEVIRIAAKIECFFLLSKVFTISSVTSSAPEDFVFYNFFQAT